MTKEQILTHLAAMEWDDTLMAMLERAVAKFVVFQKDPDDYHTYCEKYYMTEEDARKDYETRVYVPAGCWCFCILESIHDDSVYESRHVSEPLSPWD